ncbi:MAG: hypothetical protein ABMA01_16210 [Chthoniobacteraceae bacterium]
MTSRLAIFSIIALAMMARAWLQFGTPWVPGMNGAYYFVQARALLDRGTLGIPDMPLLFHLDAALAWLFGRVSEASQADRIVLAVKLCDSLLPPLAAGPVFVLVRRWALAAGRGDGMALAAAALVCLSSPLLGMVGDFQKNSLALVWLAALAVALNLWLAEHRRGRFLALMACLAALGLTHIGVLGSALVLIGAVFVVRLLLYGPGRWRARLPWLAGGVAMLAGAAGLVLWRFDAARIHRLTVALTNPAQFSSDGMQMPMPPGGAMQWMRWLMAVPFVAVSVPVLVIAWRQRKSLPPADATVAAGCALTVLALTGPWFGMDKAMRFTLIAIIPAVFTAAFGGLRITSPTWRRTLVTLALLALIGTSVPRLWRGGRPILSDAALRELSGLAPQIFDPEHTLISAQHGVEWWTAWLLHTRIAQASALRAEDWKRFQQVLFLEVKSGMQMPVGPPGGPKPPRGPGFGSASGFPAPPGDGLSRMPGGKLPPHMAAAIPPDAEIIHDGECLKLARVRALPSEPDESRR